MANFSLLAKIGVDSSGFQKGINSAGKKVDGFRSKLGSLKGALASIGFAAAISKAADYVTQMQNSARISGLASEEFQKFAFATKTVGIEQEKAADILKDVNDKVGDFLQTGAGPMADFFEKIAPKVGVTAEQFRNLSGRDALQLYVSSLEKANVSQNEMTFFLEAIASDASALYPLLQNNSKALDDLSNKAEKLGAVIDNETAEAIKNMNDSFEQAGKVGLSLAAKAFSVGQKAFEGLFATLETVRTGNNIIAAMAEENNNVASATVRINDAQATQIEHQRKVNALVAEAIGQTNAHLPSLEQKMMLQEMINKREADYIKLKKDLIDEENERFIKAKELEALQMRAAGANAEADALEKQIKLFKETIRLAKEYGITLKEAAALVKGLEANKPGDESDAGGEPETDGGGGTEKKAPRSGLTGKELKRRASELGKESGIRFERMADGTFQQFVDGKKGERFTEEQLQAGVGKKESGESVGDKLDKTNKLLQGKFVNE